MKVYYDLHIHSVLSPCGSVLQTPNNILNMTSIKGLNLIAVTDHNSCKQLPTIEKIVRSYDFIFVYGCEVYVSEGFHVLVYFENLDLAMEFDKYLELGLSSIKNEKFFDTQVICDEFDLTDSVYPIYLNQKLKYSFNELAVRVRALGGIIVLAHIDRPNTGVLNCNIDINELDFDAIELNNHNIITDIYNKYPYLKEFPVLYNSDAHDLVAINEPLHYIELDELSITEFFKYLKRR